MVIKANSESDGNLREGLKQVLPSLAAKSLAAQLAMAQIVPLFQELVELEPQAFQEFAQRLLVDFDVDIDLLKQSTTSCGLSKEIKDVCALAGWLDELCAADDLQSKKYTLEQIERHVPDVHKRRALEKQAEVAAWVTGSMVLNSASGQVREERDEKVFARCTNDVLVCLDAVGKAISVEQRVEQRLTKRYGGSSQQLFQQQIQSQISSEPKHVFGELFWKDAVHSLERKEIDSWVDARIVASERKLLASMQPVTRDLCRHAGPTRAEIG